MAVRYGVKTRANSPMSKQPIGFADKKLPPFEAEQHSADAKCLYFMQVADSACQLGTNADARCRINPS